MVIRRQARIFLIAAVASGQGKTTVTAALARQLIAQGLRVQIFKVGPDFLDPTLLERASGAPVYTLDLWMVGLEQSRSQLAQAAAKVDVILIEAVMGLYDGTSTSADLANAFAIPVLAVVDASAMAQTCGALVMGLRDYGPVNLVGVIANRIASPGHAAMVQASLRDIPLLATMGRLERSLPERHLGLVVPDEIDDFDGLLNQISAQLKLNQQVWERLSLTQIEAGPPAPKTAQLLAGKKIAIARDAAFAFIYPANLDCLQEMGAELCFFSPLADQAIPSGADALFLPGGYPELHAEALANALVWQTSILQAHADDMPIWAECGGMMALAETLIDQAGQEWSMAGILPGTATMQKRLAGLGMHGLMTAAGLLRGHTFHYSTLETSVPASAHTFKQTQTVQANQANQANQSNAGQHPPGEAVYKVGSLTASYFHAYFPSCPMAVAMLLTGADESRQEQMR